MQNLKIKVFKGNESSPETTITIPTRALKVAAHFIPPCRHRRTRRAGDRRR
ncbi:hypothetical protein HUS23_12090 [Ectothiorhodospiraceae bacterium 2226]|nr:hypothetical protein HUS23_12090 [Ectothiorhodospiraceae bacterium 2226]